MPSDSVAVVQRFGKYVKEVPPGLHFKLPLGVDATTMVLSTDSDLFKFLKGMDPDSAVRRLDDKPSGGDEIVHNR